MMLFGEMLKGRIMCSSLSLEIYRVLLTKAYEYDIFSKQLLQEKKEFIQQGQHNKN